MSRPALSIVVPTVADTAALEATLVSVLENRPDDSEIVVPLACPYDDPWNIREEVRFVQAPDSAGLVACTNLGIAASAAPVIHVLAAGCRATPGWTDHPLQRIAGGEAAAVVPLGVTAEEPGKILSAGIRVTRGGRRIAIVPGRRAYRGGSFEPNSVVPSGPALEAGFWRADVLATAGPGFPAACGDSHADADLAAALASLGEPVVLEHRSRVIWAAARPRATPFAAGLAAERLFWRSLAQGGILSRLARHIAEVARDAVTSGPFRGFSMLAGRTTGFLQYGDHVARVRQLRAIVRRAEEADRPSVRIDGAHGVRRPRGEVAPPLKRSA